MWIEFHIGFIFPKELVEKKKCYPCLALVTKMKFENGIYDDTQHVSDYIQWESNFQRLL